MSSFLKWFEAWAETDAVLDRDRPTPLIRLFREVDVGFPYSLLFTDDVQRDKLLARALVARRLSPRELDQDESETLAAFDAARKAWRMAKSRLRSQPQTPLTWTELWGALCARLVPLLGRAEYDHRHGYRFTTKLGSTTVFTDVYTVRRSWLIAYFQRIMGGDLLPGRTERPLEHMSFMLWRGLSSQTGIWRAEREECEEIASAFETLILHFLNAVAASPFGCASRGTMFRPSGLAKSEGPAPAPTAPLGRAKKTSGRASPRPPPKTKKKRNEKKQAKPRSSRKSPRRGRTR